MCILESRIDICWAVGYARRRAQLVSRVLNQRGGERNQSLRCPGYSGTALRVKRHTTAQRHNTSSLPAASPAASCSRASGLRSHPDVHGERRLISQGTRSTHLSIFHILFYFTIALEPQCSATYLIRRPGVGAGWDSPRRSARHSTDSSDSLYSRDANTPMPYQYHNAHHVINNSYSYSDVVAFAYV